jgi:hypothetical protein
LQLSWFFSLPIIKWKKYIYHTVGKVPVFNKKFVEICKFDIPNTHINDPSWLSSGTSIKSDGIKLVNSRFSKAFLSFNKNNRKRKSHDFWTTIGKWSDDRHRKGMNKTKRGYCFTMGQTGFGKMESFIFLYIWNQKCSIQYPVLHKYYTAWFSLVRYFFFPSLTKLFICAKI